MSKAAYLPVALPDIELAAAPPVIPDEEYLDRLDALQQRASEARLDAVVVYGDREHFGNMLYLTGYDPRFEEALLVVRSHARPVLILGNESIDHSRVARIDVDRVLCQSLSLLGQDRSVAPNLADSFHEIGLEPTAHIGVIGWKFFSQPERSRKSAVLPDMAVPGFVVSALADVVGADGRISDVTEFLLHANTGLRMRSSVCEIAEFEYGAALASEYVRRVVLGFEPGMTELEASSLMMSNGYPFSCHPMVISGRESGFVGLRSPSGRTIERGDALAVAVGLWGGLSSRAALVAEDAEEGARYAPGFVSDFAASYYLAIKTWYETVRVGVNGREVFEAVDRALGGAPFRLLLNPGHQTHYEEWTNSPFRPDSADVVRSGAMLQCDLIPVGASPYPTCDVEDTVCVCDEALREDLFACFPDLQARIAQRRRFLTDQLGIEPSADLLPLSNMPAWFPVLLLNRDSALSFRPSTHDRFDTSLG